MELVRNSYRNPLEVVKVHFHSTSLDLTDFRTKMQIGRYPVDAVKLYSERNPKLVECSGEHLFSLSWREVVEDYKESWVEGGIRVVFGEGRKINVL